MNIFNCFTYFDFPVDHSKLSESIDETQIISFVEGKLNHIFEKYNVARVQACVSSTYEIEPSITAFFTHIIEVGTVKTIAFNDILDNYESELIEYYYFILWSFNICLSQGLIERGIQDIPSIGGGNVPLYFSDNAIRRILERVSLHIETSQMNGIGSLDLYADSMIKNHLILP